MTDRSTQADSDDGAVALTADRGRPFYQHVTKERFWVAENRDNLVAYVQSPECQMPTAEVDTGPAIAKESLHWLGNVDWHAVASRLNHSSKLSNKLVVSALDCYLRYVNVDDPRIIKDSEAWTQEEETCLLTCVRQTGGFDWDWIASEVSRLSTFQTRSLESAEPSPNTDAGFRRMRTPVQCLRHYQQTLYTERQMANKPWTDQEDEWLMDSIQIYGYDNWEHVAHSVGTHRTPKQCATRAKILQQQTQYLQNWTRTDDQRLLLAGLALGVPSYVTTETVHGEAIIGNATSKDEDSDKVSWKVVAQLVPGK
jgi:hypothetical protein